MSEQPFNHLTCPVVVLRFREPQVSGDVLADAIRDELLQAYVLSRAVHVVLDLSVVTYLSSAGLRPFLGLHREVRAREGRMVLTNLQPAVETVLTVSRLISSSRVSTVSFEKQPDVPAAVASLYQAAPV